MEEALKLVHLSIKKKEHKAETEEVSVIEVKVNMVIEANKEVDMVIEVKVEKEVTKEKTTEKLILKKFLLETFLLKPQKMMYTPFLSKLVTSKISHY